MPTIEQTYDMAATAEAVYQAFIHPDIIEQWSGAEAIMSGEPGFEWQLWGGSILGVNRTMEPHRLIVQDWKEENWTELSTVTFTLTPIEGGTRVHMVHEKVPEASVESIANGWRDYYLGPMKDLLETA